jgi:HAD superfamily phosphoserine phosphatase-like hydrolase
MDYEQFAKTSVSLWRGMKISDFEGVIDKIPLRDGVLECLKYFRKYGYRIVCVSSGFDFWEKIFRSRYEFSFDDYLANHIVVDGQGIITGELIVNVTDDTPSLNKGEQLLKMCRKYDVQSEQAIMVGDGIGDIKAFDLAGLSFAINPTHDEVAKAADHIVDGESLIPLLDYFSDGVYNSID